MTDGARPVDNAPERLLHTIGDRHGRRPLTWAAAPLREADLVLDVGRGAGLLAAHLEPGRWVGVGPILPTGVVDDTLVKRLHALPTALPLRTNAVDAVALLLTLPRLRALDGVFAELRRVLRPGGTLVALVPSASLRSLAELRLAPLLATVHRTGWTNSSALDRAGWLLAAADFAVLADDRAGFVLPLPDAATAHALAADLPTVGLWPPDLPGDVRQRLGERLAAVAGPGRVLPVPMRRLVARR